MTIPAKSVMTTDIVTVPPEATIAETARRMLIHHVSAVPVVDPDNRPLGLVSEGDVWTSTARRNRQHASGH